MSIQAPKKGLLLAIESSDKLLARKHATILAQRLVRESISTDVVMFPRQSSESSWLLNQSDTGNFGSPEEVGPYKSSYFSALDRFSHSQRISESLSQGKAVITTGSSASAMFDNARLIQDQAERMAFYSWARIMEFDVFGATKPDLTIVLLGAENDPDDVDLYFKEMWSQLPAEFYGIANGPDSQGQSKSTAESIFDLVKPWTQLCQTSQAAILNENPYLTHDGGDRQLNVYGQAKLESYTKFSASKIMLVSSAAPRVAIENALSSMIDAGEHFEASFMDQLWRLERDDKASPASARPKLIIQKSSNLAAHCLLPDGRSSQLKMQGMNTMHLDKKDRRGRFKYYTPPYSSANLSQKYEQSMNQIFGIYSNVCGKVTRFIRIQKKSKKNQQAKTSTREAALNACQGMLPLAAYSAMALSGDHASILSAATDLDAVGLREAADISQELQHLIPEPDKGMVDNRRPGQSLDEIVEAQQGMISGDLEKVKLLEHAPLNEISIVADLSAPNVGLSTAESVELVDDIPYARKSKALSKYLTQALSGNPSTNISTFSKYRWELILPFFAIHELYQIFPSSAQISWQAATPRFGYDIPAVVEEAGLADDFERAFDISAGLYGAIDAEHSMVDAQYACLSGHHVRVYLLTDLSGLISVYGRQNHSVSPQSRDMLRQMLKELAAVHPILAKTLGTKI